MALVTTKFLLEKTMHQEHFSVPAFNVHNMEYTKGVIEAAEEMNSPVILMLGEAIFPFAGRDTLMNITKFAAVNAKVPVAVALDHGKNMDNVQRMAQNGICIMYDGSDKDFEENIRLTKEAADIAHSYNVSIEGELGALLGCEDGEEAYHMHMTSPEKAREFVERTGIDILAVSIGNVHGLYHGKADIDIDRLIAISNQVDIPIVMHGGSDLPDEISKKAIVNGISKFNVGTDLKIAFSKALHKALSQTPMPIQPKDTLGLGIAAVKETAIKKIKMMGSEGKASLYNI